MPDETSAGAWHRLQRSIGHRTAHLSPTAKGLLWTTAAGLMFSVLNAIARELTLRIDPFQSQFLRYLFGLLVLMPIVLHRGFGAYWPKNVGGQFLRGAVHTVGLCLWYVALPRIPLADMTAIGFTGPIFIMIGAYVFFREPMHWERWLATILGFAGVLIVVGPKVSGSGGGWHLVMLASAPVFAASFLLTKALTRYESAGVILLWQSIAITLFSLPLALPVWQGLTPWEWFGFFVCGLLGSGAHYCLTKSFQVADISATQSVKFLDLVWAALLGWLVFAQVPSASTLAGGLLICAATVWVAHRESRRA
jgi:drug/metabolite transporter (DMT)-like permease